MVFDFNLPTGQGTQREPQGPTGDETVTLSQVSGQVFGKNDAVGFSAFQEISDFYFTGINNLVKRRYAQRNLLCSYKDAVGMFEYPGANRAVIMVYANGTFILSRNDFQQFQGWAGVIHFLDPVATSCSFCLLGSSVFLSTGVGLYEWDFSSGRWAWFQDRTCWIGEYAVRLDAGVNLYLIVSGDVLSTPAGSVYVRGIRKYADAYGGMELWCTGDSLGTLQDYAAITVVGKGTVTGRARYSGSLRSFIAFEGLRPVIDQTYGLPVAVANNSNRLQIATTKNYLGGSYPGIPANWNLSLTNGAYMLPIQARTSLRPTQILPFQEGLFVGLSNPSDSNDGQLWLLKPGSTEFINVLNDVGPLPNTMVALIQKVYFLSGTGIYSADITNVRAQVGTKTVSGAIEQYFDENSILPSKSTWSAFDPLTGQLWYGFATNEGRVFLNMDPLNTVNQVAESNRFSFYKNVEATLACKSVESPLLYQEDTWNGNTFRLDLAGTQDITRITTDVWAYRRIAGRLITGPFQLNSNGATGVMKDVYLAAQNMQQGAIRISVLADSKYVDDKLGAIEIPGFAWADDVAEVGVWETGVAQGRERKLYVADPYQQHRGQRFRLVIEETGFNTPWEMVALSVRGLSAGYKRNTI